MTLAPALVEASQDGSSIEGLQYNLPYGESGTYHDPARWGYFSILQRRAGSTYQDSYRLSLMPDVIRALPRDRDSWISQAEFNKPNRRLVNVTRISVCWADLDIYKSDLAHLASDPNAVVGAVLAYCDDAGLLPPSLIMSSGRGLYVKWLLNNPLPAAALPRWNAVQRSLCAVFSKFGADPLARDGSRVLRIENTVNTKSGTKARVLWVRPGPDGQVRGYNFEDLAREMLPFTREQIREKRASREQLRLLHGKNTAGLRTFSAQALNWHRLIDLRKLVQLRQWHDGPVDGYQDTFLWLATCFLAWSMEPTHLFLEIDQLAREFAPTWKQQDIHRVTKTTYRRALEAAQGRKIEYGGQVRDPRYRFTNNYLIDTLKITPHEEKELRTIVSQAEARKRDAQRKTEARREAGAQSRGQYLSQAQERRFKALHLKEQGKTYAEIGQMLEITSNASELLVKRARKERVLQRGSSPSVCILV